VKAYGPFIRQALSKCPKEAAAYANRLGSLQEGSWRRAAEIIQPVDIPAVLESFKPRSVLLSEIAQEYLTLRDIDQKPPTVALSGFILFAEIEMSLNTQEKIQSCLCVIWSKKAIRPPLSEDVSTAFLLFLTMLMQSWSWINVIPFPDYLSKEKVKTATSGAPLPMSR
jgi:hypothetical protein